MIKQQIFWNRTKRKQFVASQRTLDYQTQIQGTFSPEIIRPYPKAGARNTKNKRKTRKSAILTDTPEKDALALEQSSKKRQKTEQGGAGKGKKIAKKRGKNVRRGRFYRTLMKKV
nr:unnamed protein product [Callosobruchus chinensis]